MNLVRHKIKALSNHHKDTGTHTHTHTHANINMDAHIDTHIFVQVGSISVAQGNIIFSRTEGKLD